MPAPTYLYSSASEIQQLYGAAGQSAILTDASSNDMLAAQTEAIEAATDEVLMYLGMEYNDEDMYTSSIVRRLCTTVAAHMLSQRRGNPSLFLQRYENAVIRLTQLRDGTLSLPNVRRLKDSLPSMSNYNYGGLNPINKIRVAHDSYLPNNTPNEAPNFPSWPYS